MEKSIDIVVISALKEEFDALRKINGITWNDRLETISGYSDCQTGEIILENKPPLRIVAVHASNQMGLTEAAMLTTRAFLAFNPKILVLIGICAGVDRRNAPNHQQIDIGDIILPSEAIHFYFGKITEVKIDEQQEGTEGEVKEEFKPEPKYARVQDNLFQYLIQALQDKNVLAEISYLYPTNFGQPNKKLKAHDGSMGSSDLVVAAQSRFEQAIDANRKLISVDMESYAVLRVANRLQKNAVVIKSVSDYGNKTKGQDDSERYREYAYFTAAAAFYKFVEYLATKTSFFLAQI